MIAIDWGTTALRGALLDARGAVREERAFARGILTVPAGGFPALFDELFGDWLERPGELALLAGMVGSRQGWQEAPYCECPAGLEEIAAALAWVVPGRVAIVPGLACCAPGLPGDARLGQLPDVLRGEETQVLGALQALALADALLVLPGTHSKWVEVRAGRIERFATYMTGEFYQLLRQHSILQRMLPAADAGGDDEAFARGVQVALRGEGLLHHAFGVRTLALFDQLPAAALPDYLSGLVIGEELRLRLPAARERIVVVGSEALARRYRQALQLAGAQPLAAPADVAWRGLWQLAQHLGVAA